jgi:hypothetical protein
MADLNMSAEEIVKRIFNCPEDDWKAAPFARVKEKFLRLIEDKDEESFLVKIAKSYAEDASRKFSEELAQDKDHETSMDDLFQLAEIATTGFVLMGVYYGYMLKQKENRERPFNIDWGFLDSINLAEDKKEDGSP